jgi:hypothetical protein
MAVEDRPGDQDVEWALLVHLLDDIAHIGTRNNLIARTE